MFIKGYSIASVTEMGCCGCFGFSFAKKHKKILRPRVPLRNHISQELLLNEEVEDDEEEEEEEDDRSYNEDVTDTEKGDAEEFRNPSKRSEDILLYRTQNGLICREFPVKETHEVVRSEVLVLWKNAYSSVSIRMHPWVIHLADLNHVPGSTLLHLYMLIGSWITSCEL